ncbi:hypothetical protein ABWK22_18960 [Gottfriedia acidiceleris]
MERKPRVFIGSSAEAIHYVEVVFEGLKRDTEATCRCMVSRRV